MSKYTCPQCDYTWESEDSPVEKLQKILKTYFYVLVCDNTFGRLLLGAVPYAETEFSDRTLELWADTFSKQIVTSTLTLKQLKKAGLYEPIERCPS